MKTRTTDRNYLYFSMVKRLNVLMTSANKVKPYPIALTIGTPPSVQVGHIMKLTLTGFMARMPKAAFQTGERHTAIFIVPVSRHEVNETVQVVKTYDNLEKSTDGQLAKVYLVEFHFKDLQNSNKLRIQQFLSAIKQI